MNLLHRLLRSFRDRSLRSRLALLTAAAVAVTIALAATASWFLVSNRLYDQVRTNLSGASNRIGGDPRDPVYRPVCAPTAKEALAAEQAQNALLETQYPGFPGRRVPNRWDTELIAEDGSVCFPLSSTRGIEVSSSDLSAFGSPRPSYRDGKYLDTGTPAMVRRSEVVAPDGTRYVQLVAQSVEPTEESLRGLGLVLLGVAVVGVVAAGATGRLVARSALRPVHQLTRVVEHIARTEEVGTTIPVHGHDEIARLASSFNSMSTALATSRERQTRLIADAGHELRTPLTSLRTNVDLLIRSDETGRPLPPATRTKLLGNMKDQMQELTVLIGDLLQLSRPDSPKPVRNLSVVPFHETAARAVDRARLRGPGLVYDVTLDPWYVHGDAPALERAVINLLDNAVKYSPPGGTIKVALHNGILTVRDHGPGIPGEELPYVFDRFWRSPSSRQLPGSGLGLSIVAQTVQDAGGRVTLGPAEDGGPGALATLSLPGGPNPPA